MKKWTAYIALTVAALSLSAIHTNAAQSVTNETGMSSMYGVNGQFEHYYVKQLKKPVMYQYYDKQRFMKTIATTTRYSKISNVIRPN